MSQDKELNITFEVSGEADKPYERIVQKLEQHTHKMDILDRNTSSVILTRQEIDYIINTYKHKE